MATTARRAERFLGLQRASLFAAAAAAFASMAVSRGLPVWADALFGSAWLVGLLWRERDWPRFLRGVYLATAAGLFWTLLPAVRERENLPLAAAEAALILCANRLLVRRVASDDAMLHLACWMMLAAGAALSGDLLYGVSLVVFAVLASVSMTLSELRRGIEEEAAAQAQALLSAPELTSRRLWGFSASLGLFAALFGVCLFPLFPRAKAGLLHGLAGSGSARTGIGDRVDLRATGTLTGSSRLVLRARLRGDRRLAHYWRAVTFERFTGRGWTIGQGPGRPVGGFEDHSARSLASGSFELFPSTEGYVPTPVGLLELWPVDLGVRLRESPTGDLRVLSPVPASLSFGFAAGRPKPEPPGAAELARALQLPELDPTLVELAKRIIPDPSDPAAVGARIERHFSSFRYTRELYGGNAPLRDFLRRGSGHCELFATAAVVLLRARGIPARYVAGYYADELSGETLSLREWDAHAWAEALVPGRGFVLIDATPPDFRGGAEARASLWSGLFAAWDDAQLRWLRNVIDFDAHSQVHSANWLADRVGRLTAPTHGHPVRWLLTALLSLILGPLLSRRLLRRAPVAVRLERSLFRALADLGIARRPAESAEEAVVRLSKKSPRAAVQAAPLFERLGAARFGGRPIHAGEASVLRARIARLGEVGAEPPG